MTHDEIAKMLVKGLGPWTDGKHYGATGRTIQAIGVFGRVEVTTGWENGKASAHRTFTQTAWCDDEESAIAFLETDYRARICAALNLDAVVALVEAGRLAEQQLERLGFDGFASGLTAALAAFTPKPETTP